MNILPQIGRYARSEVIYDKGGRFGPRIQEVLQLVYIFKGSGFFVVDGREFKLSRDEVILLLPDHVEEFIFPEGRVTHHGWCQVNIARPISSGIRLLESLPAQHVMSQRMKELDRMVAEIPDTNSSLRKCLIQAMFLEFFNIAGLRDEDGHDVPSHPSVEKAIRYVEEHFDKALDLTEIARQSGVSGPHLIRLFKGELDTTPIEFLWSCRIEKAANLLVNTGLSISEIGYRCGFLTPAHFSRRFREIKGVPPARHRKTKWFNG